MPTPMSSLLWRIAMVLTIILLIALWAGLDLGGLASIETLHAHHDRLIALRGAHPLLFTVGFFLIYVLFTAASLPSSALLSLAGGALFGVVNGTVLVSFASSIGATLAFLSSRYLLRDLVEARFRNVFLLIDAGMKRDGPFYLLSLRLLPAIPYFLINVAMGLTRIRPFTFYWVSQLGMFLGTIVWVNAGTQLTRIHGMSDVFSPQLVLSFALLGLFPLAARALVMRLRRMRQGAGSEGQR